MTNERPLVLVSPSEPEDATAKLQTFGVNALSREAGSDYIWYPHSQTFAIERKTTSNLLQSLKDRQLAEQAQRGVAQFDRFFLLIEGDYQNRAGKFYFFAPRHPEADTSGYVTSGWQYEAVEGMLFDLGLLGVQVVRCELYDYARRIASIVINTSGEKHNFLRERQRPDLPGSVALGGKQYNDAVWALCALPGCGPEVAMAVLKEAGSLQAAMSLLANVNASQHIRINGRKLGEKRAARIRDIVIKDWR